ncbi:MAG TPA: hypothetical protein VI796_06080 [Candidatus Thermoplasmatota archaeon]|nr:hypothetical protein [Candidatus Thermoplasmatota archaeon]
MASGLRTGATIALGAAALIMILSNFSFFPYAHETGYDATPWGSKFEGFGTSTSVKWFDGDLDGGDGVGMLRASGPLLAASIAAGVIGIILVAMGNRTGGVALSFTTGGLLAVTMLVFVLGLNAGSGEAPSLGYGFYVSIVAVLAAVAAGVMTMMDKSTAAPMGRPAGMPGGPRPFTAAAPGSPAAAPTAGRPGRCPKCKTAVTIFPGRKTVCSKCGFSA